MSLLNHAFIESIIKYCLPTEEERPAILDRNNVPEGITLGEGIMATMLFKTERLEEHRDTVKMLLGELHPNFMLEEGGGWSFLNMAVDKHGRQFGEHQTCDLLFILGNALGYAEFQLPRSMWAIMPGGMPYIVINLKGK